MGAVNWKWKELYILSTNGVSLKSKDEESGSYVNVINPDRNVKVYIPNKTFNGEQVEGYTFANVTFYYNYADNPNKGVFWIISTADKVYQPKAPKRDGYKFNGWYKQAECVNTFDFNGEYAEDETLDIYAGWTKK